MWWDWKFWSRFYQTTVGRAWMGAVTGLVSGFGVFAVLSYALPQIFATNGWFLGVCGICVALGVYLFTRSPKPERLLAPKQHYLFPEDAKTDKPRD